MFSSDTQAFRDTVKRVGREISEELDLLAMKDLFAMMQKEKPYSFHALPEYKMGWNAASAGCLAHQNPFPQNSAPLSAWNNWNNGFYDYSRSPYSCQARNWYNAVKLGGIDKNAKPANTTVELSEDEGFVATRYVFEDGSAIVHTEEFIYVESKIGEPFISVPKTAFA